MLRTNVLAHMLVARLTTLGAMTEAEALDALDSRAPGRGHEVIQWACQMGLIRRVAGKDDQPVRLEAVGSPRLAA